MWKDDNDDIERVYLDFKKIKSFPTSCPVCRELSAHIYMHAYAERTRRGGLWIWCSECHSFWHSSVYVPKFWENCELIKNEELCAVPDYLEKRVGIIDTHANSMLKKIAHMAHSQVNGNNF